jgi:predicted  nucleic acid-binding Zn-ribbon protein
MTSTTTKEYKKLSEAESVLQKQLSTISKELDILQSRMDSLQTEFTQKTSVLHTIQKKLFSYKEAEAKRLQFEKIIQKMHGLTPQQATLVSTQIDFLAPAPSTPKKKHNFKASGSRIS